MKKKLYDGSYDSVDYYASANMWQLQGQKVHFRAYYITEKNQTKLIKNVSLLINYYRIQHNRELTQCD